MLSQLTSKLLNIGKCTGIEVIILPDGELLFSGAVLKLVKNQVGKEKEFHFLSSYQELVRRCDTGLPVALTINGRGILEKNIPLSRLTDRPLETLLPNANPNELYITVTKLEALASVSFGRKEAIDKILSELKAHGFRVLQVSLGITDALSVTPFVTLPDNRTLQTPQFTLLLDDQHRLFDIVHAEPWAVENFDKIEYNVGDQYVSSPAVLAFGSGTNLLASGAAGAPAFPHDAVLLEREEFKYARLYRTALWALLITLFGLLLTNFLFYDHYFSLNKDREDREQYSQEQEEKMKKLSSSLDARQHFLDQNGWEAPSRLSFYADRIAGLVPSGTFLTDLRIHPQSASLLGEDHGISFKKDTIQVSGTCDEPTELNLFTNNLKNIQDFKEIAIRSYAYKKEIGSGIFTMEIVTR